MWKRTGLKRTALFYRTFTISILSLAVLFLDLADGSPSSAWSAWWRYEGISGVIIKYHNLIKNHKIPRLIKVSTSLTSFISRSSHIVNLLQVRGKSVS
ncbi:Hypothetical predicted protein [Octopus vulgaris]|uniref:Uncharacterized protein n=1 Tax=Octopus vulgaris TaxID=6645 RepID=A0AA36AKN3_OCTVU|nr:Hypothetical predicted protein [Octopus vulgaris]